MGWAKLVSCAMCAVLLAAGPVAARPDIGDKIKMLSGAAICRAGFHTASGSTVRGKAYLCESANLACPSQMRLSSVSFLDPSLAGRYQCTSAVALRDVDYFCTAPFRLTWRSANNYACDRKSTDAAAPACARGWTATNEDYTHGILHGEHSASTIDLQPTHLFYNCAANPVPLPPVRHKPRPGEGL